MATPRAVTPAILPAAFPLSLVVFVISLLLACCTLGLSQPMTVLHAFSCNGGDGCQPAAPPVASENGSVYGTTFYGGNDQDCVVGCGVVFQMSPPAKSGGSWTYLNIYDFTGGSDGCCLKSALTFDPKGRLYGVNNSLFRLTSTTSSFWQFTDLYIASGVYPNTPLLIDTAGNFYGVSTYAGLQNCGGYCGVVVQLVPSQSGPWTENILYQFTGGADGAFPAAIALDSTTGTLYGVASGGGVSSANCTYSGGCGTVFKLEPAEGGTWAFSILYSFNGVHDQSPYASLARDSKGDLYGLAGRGQFGSEVFRLTPLKKDAWSRSVLHTFSAADVPEDYCGYVPGYLTLGWNGSLYGSIFGDIDLYFGALFQLTPPAGGKGQWDYTTIWDFNESGPDLNPNGVVLGPDGALYGTTNGGDSTGGTVFQLQLPSKAPWPPTDFCY